MGSGHVSFQIQVVLPPQKKLNTKKHIITFHLNKNLYYFYINKTIPILLIGKGVIGSKGNRELRCIGCNFY